MLDEYKQSYFLFAEPILNLNIDKNQLCFDYTSISDSLQKEQYVAAIIYSFWDVFNRYAFKYKSMKLTVEHVYDVYVYSIMYLLDHQVWNDSSNDLYHDIKAPEKALNKILKCELINELVANTRDVRKINENSLSLDVSIETTDNSCSLGDFLTDNSLDAITDTDFFISDYIRNLILQKQYLKAFILDFMLHENVFVDCTSAIDIKHLKHLLHCLDQRYIKMFSEEYNCPMSKVIAGVDYVNNLTYSQLAQKVLYIIDKLKFDDKIISILKG